MTTFSKRWLTMPGISPDISCCEGSRSCVCVSLYQLSVHGHLSVCGSSWLHSLHCDSKIWNFLHIFHIFLSTPGLSGGIQISCLPALTISSATICCCCQLLIKVLQLNQFTTSWPRVTTKSFQKLLSSLWMFPEMLSPANFKCTSTGEKNVFWGQPSLPLLIYFLIIKQIFCVPPSQKST